jgi:hypothetical protein
MSKESSENAEMPRAISPDAPHLVSSDIGWRKRETAEGIKMHEAVMKRAKHDMETKSAHLGEMINILHGPVSRVSNSNRAYEDTSELFGILTNLEHSNNAQSLSPLNLFSIQAEDSNESHRNSLLSLLASNAQYATNTPAIHPQIPKISLDHHLPYLDINLLNSNTALRDEVDQMLSFDRDMQGFSNFHENIDQQSSSKQKRKSQMIEQTLDSPEEFSDSLEQDDKDPSPKSNLAFKRSCKICTERRVRCSGPPGPCKTCLKKGLSRDMCVFLPRRKPGPKKREFDMLIGLNSTLALTDEQFVSDSIHLVFSEFAISIQVDSVTSELQRLGFLQFNLESSIFPSDTYTKKCAIRAARLWLTVFGVSNLDSLRVSSFLK